MTREKLIELAERCEKATGPDDDHDVAISVSQGGKGGLPPGHRWNSTLPYTASLDAAMSLVPDPGEGWRLIRYSIGKDSHEGRPFATFLWGHAETCRTIDVTSIAKTEALALTAAALRARAAMEEA